ncbi:hypothetical protein BDP27DRAFT_1366925 [Rhodocollybia butyracea]|uniref:Uncharacterized protein n=1 Tax=Rhodocollybia butyracea TaxID=206335 RepID=A0A9P5PMU9_9AGAR|nr:hypothetical protein BDP27DRAFT_1366925 [Rhodocollybia butyracea]
MVGSTSHVGKRPQGPKTTLPWMSASSRRRAQRSAPSSIISIIEKKRHLESRLKFDGWQALRAQEKVATGINRIYDEPQGWDYLGIISPDLHITNVPDTGLLCDLLWSEPDKGIPGWSENDHGIRYIYRIYGFYDECALCRRVGIVSLDLEWMEQIVMQPVPNPGRSPLR